MASVIKLPAGVSDSIVDAVNRFIEQECWNNPNIGGMDTRADVGDGDFCVFPAHWDGDIDLEILGQNILHIVDGISNVDQEGYIIIEADEDLDDYYSELGLGNND